VPRLSATQDHGTFGPDCTYVELHRAGGGVTGVVKDYVEAVYCVLML